TWEGRPSLYVEDLYVAEAARGLGAGRKLLAALAALALARDCRRLDLSVLHWNPARDFYDALGFEQLSEWRPYRLAGAALAGLAAEAAD
ncbi:MAG: GNAT family N-acetyltransferase, partial [Alphaproteobacteria bacterium]|nr:GNAT family N-acetyltransferase [Alphaproteobacteria bacterium]